MSLWRQDEEGQPSDATTLEEERKLSRLLRQLPEPELPAEFRARVMARIHADEPKLRGFPAFFQWMAPARTAAVLACGLASWMFLIGVPYDDLSGILVGGDASVVDADRAVRGPIARGHQAFGPRYSVPAGALAIPAGLFRSQAKQPTPILAGQPIIPPLDRRLDRQIDHLLHNPDTFFRRFAQIRERERYLERLADRSARRGDAADVGLRVRAIQHPMAPKVSERFLRASLVPAARR